MAVTERWATSDILWLSRPTSYLKELLRRMVIPGPRSIKRAHRTDRVSSFAIE